MQYPETFAIHFARAVELFADPERVEYQKEEFRAIVALVNTGAVTLVDGGDRLLVNDVPVRFPAVLELLDRLRERGVGTVRIAEAAEPAHLYNLFRVLAGVEDGPVAAYLVATGSTTVQVGASQAAAVGGQAGADVAAPAVPEMEPLDLAGPAIPTVAEALQELAKDPAGAGAPERLRGLLAELERASGEGWVEHALTIAHALVQLEPRVTDPAVQRQYGMAVRNALERSLVERYARLTPDPRLGAAAVAVLRRAGMTGTEVLLDLLATAPTARERLAHFRALTQMSEAGPAVVRMLDDERWYVQRNVADLCGELELEEAVPRLGRLVDHADQRVRKAAASGLAKIGTPSAHEFLRKALRDPVAAVRAAVPAGLGGREASPMAMPLAAALEAEADHEVQQEVLHALGRIGTADAVQALTKAAAGGRGLFKRRRTALRVAAVEGLALAGTAAAATALESLRDDPDEKVRAAARSALRRLRG